MRCRIPGSWRRVTAVAAAGLLLAAALAPPALVRPTPGLAQADGPRDAPVTLAEQGSFIMREYPLPESATNPQPAGRAHSITVAPDGRI